MPLISGLRAREIYDSRGRPTVETDIAVDGRWIARASVPSGLSTGRHEARERRDDPGPGPTRVQGAVAAVREEIASAVVGLDPREQRSIDAALCELDGTPDKGRLGANAILSVSIASCRAAAAIEDVPEYRWIAGLAGVVPALPAPIVNMISGGLHGGGNLDLQDWLLVPRRPDSFSDVLGSIVRVYWELGAVLVHHGYGRAVGDEGGYAPALESNTRAFELLGEAAERAALALGDAFGLALDVAASQLLRDGGYRLREHSEPLSTTAFVDRLARWADSHYVDVIEDPVDEDDWTGWQYASAKLGKLLLVGDDVFATTTGRLRDGIARGVANAVLVKMNQVGTLSETLEFVELARGAGYRIVVSARSGETEDTFLADLAVGTAADVIKIGSVARSERLAKYNRLLRIQDEVDGGKPVLIPVVRSRRDFLVSP